MLQSQAPHVFSHQHQYPQADSSWAQQHQQHQQHQQQQHQSHFQSQQPQQHPSLAAQQHAQAQAQAAAAAAAAQHQQQQQQHYSRIGMTGGVNSSSQTPGGQDNGSGIAGNIDSGVSEENRKVLVWVAELLDPNRRESALMELSKKREQVPELALIIWHSFGREYSFIRSPPRVH